MRRLLLLVSLAIAAAAACGTTQGSEFGDGQPPGSSGGTSGPFGDNPSGTSSGSAVGATLHIDPPTATVTATGTLGALVGETTFRALLDGSPTPVAAKWTVDDAGIGTIDSSGKFSAGRFAGKTTVRALVGNLQATAEVIVNLKVEEDFASLTPDEKAALRAGGNADPAFRWLYPYDRTVFPRGLSAPRLQFSGAVPKAFRVHIKSQQLEYEGFYPGSGNAARVGIAQDLWKTVTQSAKAGDPVTVQVTKHTGSAVAGPITETWNIAPGSLKGTVFYNSYNSALAKAVTGFTAGGAIMRIKPGSLAEVFIGKTNIDGTDKGCIVCHSVSAKGDRIIAGVDFSDPTPVDSVSFGVSATGEATQQYVNAEGRLLPFGALTPDSKYVLGSAVTSQGPNVRGVGIADFPSRLYDAATGAVIADAHFGSGTRHAVTPAFSHDGKLLAFNDKDADPQGHVLGLLSFDASTTPPTFSGYKKLASSTSLVVAWPTFTPDGKGVLYHEGDSFDTGAHSETDTLGPLYADLKWVDVASGKTAWLETLNGWRPNGNGGFDFYLPYGVDEDAYMNYEPTMLPVAVGGYYWVVFTSRRSFGNTIYNGPSSIRPQGDKAFDNSQNRSAGYRKKLWIAAIDINGEPGTDISHPAFYLEGQEADAGNMRGFWALDPCKSDGSTCETGDDCCGGFCRQVEENGSLVKMCVPPPSGCSNDSEKCSVDADCCNAPVGTKCIGGYCNTVAPSTPK